MVQVINSEMGRVGMGGWTHQKKKFYLESAGGTGSKAFSIFFSRLVLPCRAYGADIVVIKTPPGGSFKFARPKKNLHQL